MKKLKNKDIAKIRDELLTKQGFKCGICGEDLSNSDNTNRHVDHNHETGEVRGVMCRRCNLLEGTLFYRFRRSGHVGLKTDYIGWLENHLEYLKTSNTGYEHPAHIKTLVTQFKNLGKADQIQRLLKEGVELVGQETKNDLLKAFRKLLK